MMLLIILRNAEADRLIFLIRIAAGFYKFIDQPHGSSGICTRQLLHGGYGSQSVVFTENIAQIILGKAAV